MRLLCLALAGISMVMMFGCAPPPPPPGTVVQSRADIVALTADPAHLYWSDNDGQVLRVARAGGEPEILATDQVLPMAIAVDDENVYWVDKGIDVFWHMQDGAVRKVSKRGGEVVDLARVGVVHPAIAVSKGEVFWVGSEPGKTTWELTMRKVPVSGGEPQVVSVSSDSGAYAPALGKGGIFAERFAVDETSIYWIGGSAFRASRATGKAESLPDASGCPDDISIDETNIYVSDHSANRMTVIPKSGDETRRLAGIATHFTLDAKNVYWADYRGGSTGAEITQIDKSGGMPVALASGVSASTDLVASSGRVFWADGRRIRSADAEP